MRRTSVFQSSEHGRGETDYSALSISDLDCRIGEYEKKYGMSYIQFNRQFNSSDASGLELSDLMDWEYLMTEKRERPGRRKKEREVALK